MQYFFKTETLALRRLLPTAEDYGRIYTWLCDPRVNEFYGGAGECAEMQQVLAKYAGRAIEGEVVPCIIEYLGEPIGYLQHYPVREDYDCKGYVDFSVHQNPMAIDLFIGVPALWGRGIGSSLVRETCICLTEKLGADAVYIDPQLRNPRGIRCYEKAGFLPVCVVSGRELHEGVPQDNLIMRWAPAEQLAQKESESRR